MRKEDLNAIAQLLTGMKDAAGELDRALNKKDEEKVNASKRKILALKTQIDRLI
jgi:hypothetical protein